MPPKTDTPNGTHSVADWSIMTEVDIAERTGRSTPPSGVEPAHPAAGRPRPLYAPLGPGRVPAPGQVVHLTAEASPQFASHSVLLQVVEVEPSSVDASRGRPASDAEWLYLSGWELDHRLRHSVERTVLVRAAGVLVRT